MCDIVLYIYMLYIPEMYIICLFGNLCCSIRVDYDYR